MQSMICFTGPEPAQDDLIQVLELSGLLGRPGIDQLLPLEIVEGLVGRGFWLDRWNRSSGCDRERDRGREETSHDYGVPLCAV